MDKIVIAKCVLISPKGDKITQKVYKTNAKDLNNALSKVLSFLQQWGRVFEFGNNFQNTSLNVVNWNYIVLRTDKGKYFFKCVTPINGILQD